MAVDKMSFDGRALLRGGFHRMKVYLTNDRNMDYLQTLRVFVFRRQVIGLLTFLILLSTSSVMFKRLITKDQASSYQIKYDTPERGTETPVEKSKAKKEIMLLSYGRSGTSFTSGVISYHPDVFFFFEPLHGLEFHGQQDKYFVNPYEDLSRKIVESFFTCDLLTDATFLFGSLMFLNSNSTSNFFRCFREMKPGVDHLSCFYKMFKACQQHSTVLIKTIRYRVKWAEPLLQTRPNYKLLLLYRDPRATLYSQSTAIKNFNWTQELTSISKIHCRRLEEDLRDAARLKKLYPDRVKCIRYEDGATDPHGYARGIYQFLGLDLNQRIIDYVTHLTNARGRKTLDRFGIERNAKQAMSRWRYQADYNHIQIIDRTCGHLYPDLGYSTVSSEDDLRSTRHLVGAPPEGKLF
ncbi:hypothetical protein Btru_058053 [Bulinus truncatus]|nr:hypothetical protein Btru_058053 [Bulinus truncatus]